MTTLRRTKIEATPGPNSNGIEMISNLILAGVNVVRINFSHCLAEEHIECAKIVRQASKNKYTRWNFM
jgi:pyruvate kinase